MHGNSRGNAAQILDVHSDFNKIFLKKNYDHIFAKRVISLL